MANDTIGADKFDAFLFVAGCVIMIIWLIWIRVYQSVPELKLDAISAGSKEGKILIRAIANTFERAAQSPTYIAYSRETLQLILNKLGVAGGTIEESMMAAASALRAKADDPSAIIPADVLAFAMTLSDETASSVVQAREQPVASAVGLTPDEPSATSVVERAYDSSAIRDERSGAEIGVTDAMVPARASQLPRSAPREPVEHDSAALETGEFGESRPRAVAGISASRELTVVPSDAANVNAEKIYEGREARVKAAVGTEGGRSLNSSRGPLLGSSRGPLPGSSRGPLPGSSRGPLSE